MTDALISVEFGGCDGDAELPYETIGAIADMALSTAGATIAELDLSDTALRELLDVLTVTGSVTAASIDPASGVLEVHCECPPSGLDEESLELIALGFADIEVTRRGVRCSFARLRADS